MATQSASGSKCKLIQVKMHYFGSRLQQRTTKSQKIGCNLRRKEDKIEEFKDLS